MVAAAWALAVFFSWVSGWVLCEPRQDVQQCENSSSLGGMSNKAPMWVTLGEGCPQDGALSEWEARAFSLWGLLKAQGRHQRRQPQDLWLAAESVLWQWP